MRPKTKNKKIVKTFKLILTKIWSFLIKVGFDDGVLWCKTIVFEIRTRYTTLHHRTRLFLF